MTPQKIISNRTVLHLFNSLNRRCPKCLFCGTINCLRDKSTCGVQWLPETLYNSVTKRALSTMVSIPESRLVSAETSQIKSVSKKSSRFVSTTGNSPISPARDDDNYKSAPNESSTTGTNTINNNNYYNFPNLNSTNQIRHSSTSSSTSSSSSSSSSSPSSCSSTSTSPSSGTTSGQNYNRFPCLSEITIREVSTQARHQVKEKPDYIQHETFRCSDMDIVKCAPSELRQKPSVDKLVFGHSFTDHMFRVDWDHENGWSTPLISKIHTLDIHPGAKVFHYALEAFEGAKAYRGNDNKIRFFRLDLNIKRLLQSARRLSLPEFDEREMIKCIHKLVQLEQDWIPVSQGRKQLTSLYVRPTILGVEPSLGVASSKKAILYVLLSPVGPYFKTGFKPVSLYADPDVVRAWPGGSGCSKLGSNYAPTIRVQKQAEQLGLQQVLWLFGEDERLTEVGTMNIFVTYRDANDSKIHLVTPPLSDGLILPGITRQSILEMACQWPDVVCEERYVTISEIQNLIRQGQLLEMFGSGTACIVCPISSIHIKDGRKIEIPSYDITGTNNNNISKESDENITNRILKTMTDIQYGVVQHPWAQELGYFR